MNVVKRVTFPRMPLPFFALSAIGGWTVIVCALFVITWVNEKIQIEERAHTLARTIYYRDFRSTMLLGRFQMSAPDTNSASGRLTSAGTVSDSNAFIRYLSLVNIHGLKNVPTELAEIAPVPISAQLISIDSSMTRYAGTHWERQVLSTLAEGESEYYDILQQDNGRYLRFVGAVRDGPSCLRCHERKEYREGKLRGAMSVSVPIDLLWQTELNHRTITLGVLGCVWVLGLIWITLMHRGMTQRIRERDRALEESHLAAQERSAAESALMHSSEQLQEIENRLHAEKLRTEIAGNLHDDLGATLSSTSIFSELLSKEMMNASPRAQKLLARIKYNLLTVQLNLHDIVWAINPGNDSLETMMLKLQEYASDLFEDNGIALHSDASSITQPLLIPMELRKELFLIFKEACNNIVRHARAHEVRLTAECVHNHLHLSIADDGIGLPPHYAGTGNGLKNMHRRAETFSGTVRIDSDPGTGTVVHIIVPLA